MAERGIPRSIEAGIALVACGATAPLLVAIGLLVRATSKGPALFRQSRVGRNGRPFTLFKLRTMKERSSGIEVTTSNDDRVTAIGRVLRKTKLDELPSLWNVVRGDMSLVGPRPEVPRYVDLSDPLWKTVLEQRPGLTNPLMLRLRNEEEFMASAPGDPEEYYRRVLLPFKLRAFADYGRRRTWRTDVQVLLDTVLVVVLPGRAPPPTPAEVETELRR